MQLIVTFLNPVLQQLCFVDPRLDLCCTFYKYIFMKGHSFSRKKFSWVFFCSFFPNCLIISQYLIVTISQFHSTFSSSELSVTTWKVSKHGVFIGPYFPVFGLNTGKYEPEKASFSKYWKNRYWMRLMELGTEEWTTEQHSPRNDQYVKTQVNSTKEVK